MAHAKKIAEIVIYCYQFPQMRYLIACLFFFTAPFHLELEAAPAECEVYFSPKDHLADRLIALIDQEKKSIKVAVYCLTHREIAEALVRAKERGVAVEVIVDPFAVKNRSSIFKLLRGHVPIFVWDYALRSNRKLSREHPVMHDKFCILGDSQVWTGSFNFTYRAATAHQENAVVMQSREITGKYLDQFTQMKLYETRPYHEYLAHHPPNKGKKK